MFWCHGTDRLLVVALCFGVMERIGCLLVALCFGVVEQIGCLVVALCFGVVERIGCWLWLYALVS